MTTSIVKWGNSQGIRLPKVFLQNINISENDKVDVSLENDKIIIKKMYGKKHLTTKERIEEYYSKENKNTKKQEEIDWGIPEGKEVW
jgi:antitoxin MazE